MWRRKPRPWTQWLRLPYQTTPPRETADDRRARLIRAHDDALAFLTSPAAIGAYQRLLQRYADEILEAPPEAVAAREQAYTRAHVLQELVKEMAGAVQAWEVEQTRMEQSQ